MPAGQRRRTRAAAAPAGTGLRPLCGHPGYGHSGIAGRDHSAGHLDHDYYVLRVMEVSQIGVTMGTSPVASRARPAAGPEPFALLEFAISQALDSGASPDSALPAVLRRCATAFGCRAALAVVLRPGQAPELLAAHPATAIGPRLLAAVGTLLTDHPEVVQAGGCAEGPRPGGQPGSLLAACANLHGGHAHYALVLVASRPRWTAETRAAARALAAVIAAQQRAADGRRETADRRAVADALIRVASDAVVISDADRRIVVVNPAAERMFGRPAAGMLGRDMPELLVPARDRARVRNATQEFLRTGDPGEFADRLHLRILRADGTERTAELTPLPVTVDNATYFCGFLRDVTELEQANAALTASEARLRLLSQLAPVGIARTDPAARCVFVNERWSALAGQPAEDLLGQSWLGLVHADDVDQVREQWARARSAGAELRADCRLQPRNGPPVWVHAAVAALPGQPDPPGFMVALTNISARKQAEQDRDRLLAAEQAAVAHLTEQTERLNSLIAAAIPGVLLLDEANIIVQANQSLCDLLGIADPPGTLIGAPGERLRPALDRTVAEPAGVIDRIIQHSTFRPRVTGLRVRCADGRTLEYDSWPVLVDGQYRGGFLLLWDMTEQAAAQAEQERKLQAGLASRRAAEQGQRQLTEQNYELRELDEMKTRFVAMVSHELGSPLFAIVSYADLILEVEPGLSADSSRFLGVIRRSADRVIHMVNDLQLLSKIEAGVMPLNLAVVEVPAIVAEAVQAAVPAAGQRGVALDGGCPAGPPVLADRLRLLQVLDNLIGNAVKFTDRGGQVTVSAGLAGPEWRIEVSDTGMGVPVAEQDRLFDRFFRASNATSADRPGSGLGLSIVKEIAELHGGRVTVTSSEGRGATFSVYLPAYGAATA